MMQEEDDFSSGNRINEEEDVAVVGGRTIGSNPISYSRLHTRSSYDNRKKIHWYEVSQNLLNYF